MNGQLGGPRRLFWKTGKPKLTAAFHQVQPHGAVRERYASGQRKSLTEYRLGKMHGRCQRRHLTGAPPASGTYPDGVRDAPWRSRYDGGMLRWRGRYVRGQLHGTMPLWGETGSITAVNHYNHGTITRVIPYRNGRPMPPR